MGRLDELDLTKSLTRKEEAPTSNCSDSSAEPPEPVPGASK